MMPNSDYVIILIFDLRIKEIAKSHNEDTVGFEKPVMSLPWP